MPNLTLRQMKQRIADLTADEIRQILASQDAQSWRENYDESDFYDILMEGHRGYNELTEDELRKELDERLEGYDLEDQYTMISSVLD